MSFAAAAGNCPNGSPRPSTCSSTAAPFWPRAERPRLSLAPQVAAAQRVTDLPDPTGEPLPGQAQRGLYPRPPGDRREVQLQLQQFLRVRPGQDDRQGGAGAEAAAVDDQARRHGREAAGDRHRRSPAARCRWKSGSTAIAASRPGRWRFRGPASRWPSWWNWRSRCRRRSSSAWRPSSIRRSRPASARPGTHGRMSRA